MKHVPKYLKVLSPAVWIFFICAIIVGGLGLSYSGTIRAGSFDIEGFLIGAGAIAVQIGMLIAIHIHEERKRAKAKQSRNPWKEAKNNS